MKKYFITPKDAPLGKSNMGAFTLIELLIVIVVIAILVSVTLPVSKYIARRAREASQQIYLEKMKSALEEYRAVYGEYPITPPNEGANRHYFPAEYLTINFYYLSGSPYTSVQFSATTLEPISVGTSVTYYVDYSLTFPLMLRQRAEGVRPLMEFPDYTVLYLMVDETKAGTFSYTLWRKTASGPVPRTFLGLYGEPVNRPKAIDPVSRHQWKYESTAGVTYSLSTHPF